MVLTVDQGFTIVGIIATFVGIAVAIFFAASKVSQRQKAGNSSTLYQAGNDVNIDR